MRAPTKFPSPAKGPQLALIRQPDDPRPAQPVARLAYLPSSVVSAAGCFGSLLPSLPPPWLVLGVSLGTVVPGVVVPLVGCSVPVAPLLPSFSLGLCGSCDICPPVQRRHGVALLLSAGSLFFARYNNLHKEGELFPAANPLKFVTYSFSRWHRSAFLSHAGSPELRSRHRRCHRINEPFQESETLQRRCLAE